MAALTLMQRAIALLARREHSRVELERKLQQLLARQAARERATLHGGGAGRGFRGARAGKAAATAATSTAALPDASARFAQKPSSQDRERQALEISQVLDRLQAEGKLSDQRFVDSMVRGRAIGRGSARIAYELKQHGLAPDLVDGALTGLRETEAQRAHALWARRFTLSSDAKERARQYRFLAARGFSGDVIKRVIGGGVGDDELGEGY